MAFHQTNHEGALVDLIQAARRGLRHSRRSRANYTHISVAVRDALAAFDRPVFEVHLSNVHRREPFRSRSHGSGVATGVVAGLGPEGHAAALRALARMR